MIELPLTILVDNQTIFFGALMFLAMAACFSTYKRSRFAATWFVLPIGWILFAAIIGDIGITHIPRAYCKSDGGLDHYALSQWPKKSYAVCRDKVDEDFRGKTITLRTKGIFGTPIADLPRFAK